VKLEGRGLGACVLMLSLASAPAPTQAKEFKIEHFQWTADPALVAGIRRVELRNDYGDIRARAGIPGMLEVYSVIQRLGPGPEDVGVNVVRHEEVLAVTVSYPPGRRDVDHERLEKGQVDRCDTVIYVPPGVELAGQSFRGIVEARNLQGSVSASTLDGEIRVSATGTVRARSRDGAITVVFPKSDGRSGVSLLESETGTLSVTVPAGSDVELRAETGGAITGNLPGQVVSDAGRRRLSFRSGPGKHSLLVASGSGNVELNQP
jgi:hypothetical protein